jgi:hypothetical protein
MPSKIVAPKERILLLEQGEYMELKNGVLNVLA